MVCNALKKCSFGIAIDSIEDAGARGLLIVVRRHVTVTMSDAQSAAAQMQYIFFFVQVREYHHYSISLAMKNYE